FMANTKEMRRGLLLANVLLSVVVVMIIIGFGILGKQNYSGQYAELLPNLQLLGLILVAGCTISISSYLSRKYVFSFYALPATVFLITFVLTTSTLPKIEYFKGTKVLANKVSAVIQPGEEIAAYKIGNRPGVIFYNKKRVIFLNGEKELEGFLLYKNGYLFTTKEEVKNIKYGKLFAEQGDLAVLH
ncbi:MAG: hypothetical protein ABIE84_05765, partial [bacterium]